MNIKLELQRQVLDRISLTKDVKDEEIRNVIDEVILSRSKECYIPLREKEQIGKEIFNSIRRLDILQELVEEDTITEIMVNGPNQIFIEQNGKIQPWTKRFESKQKLEDVIQQIVSKANRIINEANPIVDVRLEDGSRVNIILSPIALEGPVVTIRKFPQESITMEKLVELGSLEPEIAEFLRKLIIAKYNIFISGGTGSGKTTFLNALSNYIPEDERIITIEDSAELQINRIPNLVRLEVRNANVEGKNEISIRDLIKSSLRMRPDRIIVGEVRDAAAIDMLAALNTGHDGSLSTGHANNPRDMLGRLESLVLMGMDIPLMAVRKQIASAIDIIVHLGRLRDKSRKTLEIVEVLDCVEGEIQINPLYLFCEEGEDSNGKIIGSLRSTENELINQVKLRRAGISIS
jgi:Flp pilus assembly protein, ATPase CpaF